MTTGIILFIFQSSTLKYLPEKNPACPIIPPKCKNGQEKNAAAREKLLDV
jgi:hypothetical protein